MVIFNCFGTKTLEFLNVSTNMMLHVFSTVNSEIFATMACFTYISKRQNDFARILFSPNFAHAKFREKKTRENFRIYSILFLCTQNSYRNTIQFGEHLKDTCYLILPTLKSFQTLHTVCCMHGLSIYEIKRIYHHAQFFHNLT